MSDYFIIHLSTTIVIILATFVLANVCIRKRELFYWLLAYIAASLSEIFRLFSQVRYDTLELVSIIFSALAVLIFIIAVTNEYYHTFLKKKIIKKEKFIIIC